MTMKIAVLDDWQRIAEQCADWTLLRAKAEVTFFYDAFATEDLAAEYLREFDVVMAMRERTAFPASLVKRLPKLRLFSMTGSRGGSIDMAAMRAQGVTITGTSAGGTGTSTAELALCLMLASARNIAQADATMRRGGFQDGVAPGYELAGKVLGLIGLGRLGQKMAQFGVVLGMKVIAWSPNLTPEKATAASATYVPKEDLLATADVISVHLVLSTRTRGILGAGDLAGMKRGALLINTSRGPLIDENALIAALQTGNISAALDVYDREPLPPDHPFRKLPNTLLTPHLGYGTIATYRDFYREAVENVLAFLDGAPIRVLQPAS
jgi:phosphoglycerate dehydrogenase-like enzyme